MRLTLSRMASLKDYKAGGVLALVERDADNRWRSRAVDLEIVKAVPGTRGARGKQATVYEREHRARRKAMDLGQYDKHRGL